MKRASCLVNPRAGYESELIYTTSVTPLKLAVVGAGAAGLAFATVAARRGHDVTLYEESVDIGGQFNLAKQVPGKEEFHETIRYYKSELADSNVNLKLGQRASADDLLSGGFDKIILSTGVKPRPVSFNGSTHPKVVMYNEALDRSKPVGKSVAVIGAGGVGFDVSEFLVHNADATEFAKTSPHTWPSTTEFLNEWGIDGENENRGGLLKDSAKTDVTPQRDIFLLQRKKGKHGAGLGRTTGWIHRANLKKRGVHMLSDVVYEKVDDDGLHIKVKGIPRLLPVDTVVVCAGQTSVTDLESPLADAGIPVFKIGGAHLAAELDAKRAIDQGSRLAADIENATPEKVGEYVAPVGTSAVLYQKLMG